MSNLIFTARPECRFAERLEHGQSFEKLINTRELPFDTADSARTIVAWIQKCVARVDRIWYLLRAKQAEAGTRFYEAVDDKYMSDTTDAIAGMGMRARKLRPAEDGDE
jgi:hypothetical protein